MTTETNVSNVNQGLNTDAGRLYNDKKAVLQLGYWRDKYNNDVGTIRISPAYVEPKDGKVFNYDKAVSVFFTINARDLPKITAGIKHVLSCQDGIGTAFCIKHYGEKIKTALMIGNNLTGYDFFLNIIELDESFNIKNDLIFNFAPDEGDDVLLLDVDVSTLEGSPAILNSSLAVFTSWLKSVERVINKENQHSPNKDTQAANRAKSPVISPEKMPRERKINPAGPSRTNKPIETIDSSEAAAKLFE